MEESLDEAGVELEQNAAASEVSEIFKRAEVMDTEEELGYKVQEMRKNQNAWWMNEIRSDSWEEKRSMQEHLLIKMPGEGRVMGEKEQGLWYW